MSRVVERDLGYKAMLKAAQQLKGSYVKVGFQLDDQHAGKDGDSLTVAAVAAVNEFGSEDGRVPSRPSLRPAFDQNKRLLVRVMEAQKDAILLGQRGVEESLRAVGELHTQHVQAAIDRHPPPPNAPATLAQKGEGKGTLVDSGQTKQAVRYVVTLGSGHQVPRP